MLCLYLDESGDLGFDLFTKRPSKFFTITILAVSGNENNRQLIKGVKKTLQRKLTKQKRNELKGSKDSLQLKNYFYKQVSDISFEIYALTLNKKKVYRRLSIRRDRVFNYMARRVTEQVPLDQASNQIVLFVDKSKGKREIAEFNSYLIQQLEGTINPRVPFEILHRRSVDTPGLQAADLFSWGIYRKHERKDSSWYRVFQSKIRLDDVYLP